MAKTITKKTFLQVPMFLHLERRALLNQGMKIKPELYSRPSNI
jgi:hypothetical protein